MKLIDWPSTLAAAVWALVVVSGGLVIERIISHTPKPPPPQESPETATLRRIEADVKWMRQQWEESERADAQAAAEFEQSFQKLTAGMRLPGVRQ